MSRPTDLDGPDGLSCDLQYKISKIMNIYKDVVFFTSENSERVSGNQRSRQQSSRRAG